MRRFCLVALVPLALSGCISFSSSSPPRQTVVTPTVVVPSGTAVVCSNGLAPPC